MTVAKAYVSISEIDGIDAAVNEIVQALDGQLEDVAGLVEQEAQGTAAFVDKTGKLRKTIKKLKSKFDKGGWIVKASGPHAHLVEYGHFAIPPGKLEGGRVPPHPFLRPALEKGIAFAVAKFRNRKL